MSNQNLDTPTKRNASYSFKNADECADDFIAQVGRRESKSVAENLELSKDSRKHLTESDKTKEP